MKNSPDPAVHRQREQQLIQHVQSLLDDDRLRVDTSRGRRPVNNLLREVNKSNRAVDLKRVMSELGVPDRELEARMPVGESMEILLARRKWFILRQPVGRLKVVCLSPTRALLKGEEPKPMTPGDVQKALSEVPPPLRGVPLTLVLVSTSGFTLEAHELAERRADRTLILVEPNDAGGWSVHGPAETKSLTDLFDPEAEEEKRQRVRTYIAENKGDLITSGIATDRIVAKTQLPLQMVENELKAYAKENAGLVAKRLDGKVVLFREGAAPAASAPAAGGSDMPFFERVKSLFSIKGENEKKIAFLSERRTALNQQADRMYEDMSTLETKEAELRQQFKEARAPLTKKRITSQLLQLRKDMERRQQLLGVLNQQINVVSTHLHNLELVQQGQTAKLPDSEELTSDAVAAEEMLAKLEADNELASSVGTMTSAGLSAEEQALYEELEREAGEASQTKVELESPPEEFEEIEERAKHTERPTAPPPVPTKEPAARRTEPEAG
jgi:hypothetical protein